MSSASPRRHQRGMSLVELMVGVVIGLFIVAAATVMAATQLTENRKLLLDTQVQQDMRATMDIITRELRRSGHHTNVLNMVWDANAPAAEPVQNTLIGPVLLSSSHVRYEYKRARATAIADSFEFFLEDGVIKSQAGALASEPLTDSNTLVVDEFEVKREPDAPYEERLSCPTLCAGNTENCWPSFTTYDLVVTLKAHAKSDPNVKREMVTRIRPRNDAATTNFTPSRLCPP
jgi:prepilin-type N-terminal cleavage/methylation domain-containing protein